MRYPSRVKHNPCVEELSQIIGRLPASYADMAAFLVVMEVMAIAGAIAMKRLGATEHPLYNPLLWLVGLPPLGVGALAGLYGGNELLGYFQRLLARGASIRVALNQHLPSRGQQWSFSAAHKPKAIGAPSQSIE